MDGWLGGRMDGWMASLTSPVCDCGVNESWILFGSTLSNEVLFKWNQYKQSSPWGRRHSVVFSSSPAVCLHDVGRLAVARWHQASVSDLWHRASHTCYCSYFQFEQIMVWLLIIHIYCSSTKWCSWCFMSLPVPGAWDQTMTDCRSHLMTTDLRQRWINQIEMYSITKENIHFWFVFICMSNHC